MKFRKKAALTVATMVMALCLMAVGVFAAVTQEVDIRGKITVEISNPSNSAVMAVVAYIKEGETGDYNEYGNKPASAAQITFNVPNITLNETNYFLVHKLEFINYGAAITRFKLSVSGSESEGTAFTGNFDYFIEFDENPPLANTDVDKNNFMPEGTGGSVTKIVYVRIQLKDEPVTVGSLTAEYSIMINYFV